MIAIAHFVAVTFYLAAAAVAALPFARRVKAPVASVIIALLLGVGAHATALAALTKQTGAASLTGLGPGLSFAGLVLALSLVVVESLAREVSLTLVAAPVAALVTMAGNLAGLHPFLEPQGTRAVWLTMHIVLSFVGIAAYATAAAAGVMYLVARRELKSARFGAIFRFFPPLDTLDRVNHLASIAGFLGLTLGVALAAAYSFEYRAVVIPQIIWGIGAWIGVSALALGRVLRGWQARRAALMSAVTFASVIALYVVFRIASLNRGQFRRHRRHSQSALAGRCRSVGNRRGPESHSGAGKRGRAPPAHHPPRRLSRCTSRAGDARDSGDRLARSERPDRRRRQRARETRQHH